MPETRVLSAALEEAVSGWRVRTAVFVTYELDPAFFEHSILPLLFEQGFSERERVRRVELEGVLRTLDHLAVYYDRHGLRTETGSARLDYQRCGVSLAAGVLHAKNVLLLVEKEVDEEIVQRLIVLTTSANLTRGGWWENVEAAHIETINEDSKSLLRNDLLGKGGLLARLRALDDTGTQHPALGQIQRFLVDKVRSRTHASVQGMLLPRLYCSGEPFAHFVADRVGGLDGLRLDIISPFFEDTAEAAMLGGLLDELGYPPTNMYLPRNNEGEILCSEEFHSAVAGLGVRWADLDASLTRRSKQGGDGLRRFVHAKVYRAYSPRERRELLFVGSVNLTGAAHRGARHGNLETAMFVEVPVSGRPKSWLTPLDELPNPVFRPQACEDDPSLNAVWPVSVRFDWEPRSAAYYWEGEPPPAFALRIAGIEVARVENPVADRWAVLGEGPSAELGERLQSTSFIEICVDGAEPQRILVNEIGMDLKPSLLFDLSAADILEYWSLLSPEQRTSFLEDHIARMTGDQELARGKVRRADTDSFFDRFAGIFHAFSCLEERVVEDLERGTPAGERQARYRLFGGRHDSLSALADKLLDSEEDLVNRYLSLLCARQVERRVRGEFAEFAEANRSRMEALSAKLDRIDELRSAFSFGSTSEREEFLRWLEDMFWAPVRLPEGWS